MFGNSYLIDVLAMEAQLTSSAFGTMWHGLRDEGPCRRGGYRKIERVWRRVRRIDRVLTQRLEQTLITPLNAEDIRAISVQLNKILENLAEAAWEQSALQAESVPGRLTKMYEYVFRSSEELARVVASLPKGALVAEFACNLRENHRRVKELERHLVADLMALEQNPIEVMRWKQLYELPGAIVRRLVGMACNLQMATLRNN